jgi:pimeloyl-ACP methyl ester carboxylesterase
VKPVYLGSVAGVLHPPEGTPTGHGVLLVPPFGWDDQSAYRPRRTWAHALAADGHTVLRIDLPGTGDSGGSARDEGLVDAWRAAIADAARWLAAEHLTIVAMGLGGLLALAAEVAAEGFVLWGVPGSGRSALRELKAFGRLEASRTGEDPGEAPDGELRAGGHIVTAATAETLLGLDAAALAAERAPRRALLLGRDGTEPDAGLRAALERAGAVVETDPGEGWGAAVAGPQEACPPRIVIERTRTWLGAQAGAAPAPAAVAQELALGGVRERVLPLPNGCFGVLAEPAGERGDLTAVLLNAGAIRHIGPNRMWVEAARRWAARGVPTLRVDVEGIGEADGSDEPFGEDSTFYTPELAAQVPPLLDALATAGLPQRFLLAGLCSGSYWSLHTADADPRVASAVLLNPRLLLWDAQAAGRREARRALSAFTPAGFRRLLRAERPLKRMLTLLRWLVTRPFGRAPQPEPGQLDALIGRLRSRGQRIELAFSGDEPLHDELRRDGTLDRLALAVHELPYHSHTLKPLGAQQAAHAVLDAALDRAQ